MPRNPRAVPPPSFSDSLPAVLGFADALGEALGRGVARGIHLGINSAVNFAPAHFGQRKPGRPAKLFNGVVPADKQCKVAGCGNPARSKGLCSRHYQADRRARLAKA